MTHRCSGKLIVTALGLLTGAAVSLPAWAEEGAVTAAPDAKPAQQGADDAAAAAPKAARATRGTAAHETNLGTVTVTARRRKESIQDVPVAVSALSGDTIKNNELRVVNDVTKYVPNFTGQSTEGRERPRWFLRGVGSNDPSDLSLAIGVYFDDVTSTACSGRASRCSTSIASKCCAAAGTPGARIPSAARSASRRRSRPST